jgi:hypothetical protein
MEKRGLWCGGAEPVPSDRARNTVSEVRRRRASLPKQEVVRTHVDPDIPENMFRLERPSNPRLTGSALTRVVRSDGGRLQRTCAH